jgi:hypothetical protein
MTTNLTTPTCIGWPSIITLFRVSPVCFPFRRCDAYSILLHKTGTSVDVERVFSQGRLLLPYVRNRLSSESTRALLCLSDWSRRGLLRDSDIKPAAILPDVNGEEPPLPADWDKIA